MEQLAINIVGICTLIVSFVLFRKGAGTLSINRLNLFSYSYYIHFVLLSFIGAMLIINNVDNHYVIAKLRNQESSRMFGWMAIMYSMIMMPLGVLLAKRLFKVKDANALFGQYCSRNLKGYLSKKDNILKMLLYGISAVACLAVVYTFISLPKIPIIEALKGNSDLAKLRIDASMGFSGNVYIRNILGIQLTPILAFVSFAYYKQSNQLKDLLWAVLMFGFSLLILTYDLQKSPFAFFLLGYVFLIVLIQGKIPMKKLLPIGLSALFIVGMMYFIFTGGNGSFTLDYNSGILGRTFLSQIAGTFVSFDIFPQLHEHIGFDSMSNLLSIFDVEPQDRAARTMMAFINPGGVAAGTAGVQNTLFIGEAWANFGLLGVLISPLYVGFFLGCIYYFFLKAPKTPIYLGFFAFFSGQNMVVGGINDFIYNIVYLSMFFVLIALLSFARAWFYSVEPKTNANG